MCERTLTSDVNKLSPPSLSGENVSDVNLDRTFPTGRCMHLLLNLIDREVGVAFLLSLGGRYKLFIDATILDHVRVRSVQSIIEVAVDLSSDFRTRSMGALMVSL